MKYAGLIVFFFITLTGKSQKLLFKNYTVQDGISSNYVYDIIQDKNGFIWVASENGVSRFDGISFKNFSIQDGLADNEILKIREDKKGRIWFLGYNGKLSIWDNGVLYNEKTLSILKKLNFNYLAKELYEDIAGNIWISSMEEGIKCLKPNNQIVCYSEADKSLNNLSRFYEKNNSLYIENNNITVVLNNQSFKKSITRSPTYISKNIKKTPVSYHNHYFKTISNQYASHIDRSAILDILVDNNNQLWIATKNELIVIGNEKETHYLKGYSVTSLLEDSEGNIWAGTLGAGIRMIPILPFYALSNSIYPGAIYSLTKAGNKLIAGTAQGSIVSYSSSGEQPKEYYLNSKPEINKVRELYTDVHNRIWCGTDQGVFLKYPNDKIKCIIPNISVKDFSIRNNDSVYFASSSGIYEIDINTLKYKQISPNRYTSIYADKESIIGGAIDGLSVLGKNKKSLSDTRITAIHLFNRIKITGTYGDGIHLESGTHKFHLNEQNGLSGNIVRSVAYEPNVLWVGTNKGLNKVILSHNAPSKIITYSSKDGLPSEQINAILKSGDTLYLATDKGISFFLPEKARRFEQGPKIYITATEVNQQPINTSKLKSLNSDQNNLRFEFTGIALSSLGNLNYEYKLQGIDDHWVEAKTNFAEYRRLNPGHYTFLVRAISKHGFKSNHIAKALIIIAPHYSQTWWFRTLAIFSSSILLGFSAFLIWKNYKKKHEQKLKLLELEQSALINQMNPHFIFNSLNSIQQFILTSDKRQANKYLTSFALLMRKFIDNSKTQHISLHEELESLKLYLQLENLRIDNRIQVEIEQPKAELGTILIPSMFLQPIVENSVLHGLIPLNNLDRTPRLSVKITQIDTFVEIAIEDNGIGRTASGILSSKRSLHTSTTLKNIRERIRILNKIYNFQAEFILEDLRDETGNSLGTRVKFVLPFKKNTLD